MERESKFTGHQKRVTLTLARLSQACAENSALLRVLEVLPSLDWDIEALPQDEVELIYAAFDGVMEAKIISEFEADPTYLIDLGVSYGVCPLCGHVGCRWIFRVRNKLNQKLIECGSDCIITHKLNVAGAETAEHARKILEKQIRIAVKKLRIEAWHKETGFSADWLHLLMGCCSAYIQGAVYGYKDVSRIKFELAKIGLFYEKKGWLTQRRWRKLASLYGQMKAAGIRVPVLDSLEPEKTAVVAIIPVTEEVRDGSPAR